MILIAMTGSIIFKDQGNITNRCFSVARNVILYEWDTIRLSEKCLSFTDTSFITMHIYTNVKPNLSNDVIFILTEQKWIIRNSIK